MIEALVRDLDPRWMARVEVPIPRPARGIVDLVLTDQESPAAIIGEAQSELRQLEQQLRWFAEKADAISIGSRPASRLLILRSTEATREIARRYAATLHSAYPARTSDVVDALTGDAPWPADGIVWMRLERGIAELLRHPPRGVALGR